MGFSNSVIGGAAALIRAAIKSPNFVHGSAGWQVSKDGSAEFNNVTVRGNIAGTDFLIDQAGNFFLLNSHGKTIALFSPADGGAGGLWVYADAGAVQGVLVLSAASAAGTDTVTGAPFPEGMAAYTTILGTTYAIQLGESTISGNDVPGLFLLNQTGPAPNEPPLFSFGNASTSGTAVELYSGTATPASTPSFIECADSTLSGTPGGAVVISGGNFNVDAAGNVTMGNNLLLTPKIATPPNTAAVKAQTATLAQAEACLGALIQSMQNRGMVS